MQASKQVITELAPTGRLRAAINYGNPVLVQKDPATAQPVGVSPRLAQELARRLGTPLDYVPFNEAGEVVAAVHTDHWDVAFLAIDPVREQDLSFTAPYVLIEGCYVVRSRSPIRSIEDVDRPGVRVAVGERSAYDLYLSRTLAHARLIRVRGSSEALDRFLANQIEVGAGVRQPVEAFAAQHRDLRVIEPSFMVIRQAMVVRKGHDAGLEYVRRFVEEMKASGFVAQALRASGKADVTVAPPAGKG